MNTIRELKQQEKYKTMLKRKNKEKDIYKTQNQTLRIKYEGIKKLLEKKDKEIERLNNELKLYKDNHDHLNNLLQQKENIIKEVREYIEEAQEKDEDKESCSLYVPKLLELLKGE